MATATQTVLTYNKVRQHLLYCSVPQQAAYPESNHCIAHWISGGGGEVVVVHMMACVIYRLTLSAAIFLAHATSVPYQYAQLAAIAAYTLCELTFANVMALS